MAAYANGASLRSAHPSADAQIQGHRGLGSTVLVRAFMSLYLYELKQWRDALILSEDDRLSWKLAEDDSSEQFGQTRR
jgi:hypothetical protein